MCVCVCGREKGVGELRLLRDCIIALDYDSGLSEGTDWMEYFCLRHRLDPLAPPFFFLGICKDGDWRDIVAHPWPPLVPNMAWHKVLYASISAIVTLSPLSYSFLFQCPFSEQCHPTFQLGSSISHLGSHGSRNGGHGHRQSAWVQSIQSTSDCKFGNETLSR